MMKRKFDSSLTNSFFSLNYSFIYFQIERMDSNNLSPEDEKYYQREREKIIQKKIERQKKRQHFLKLLKFSSWNLTLKLLNPTTLVSILLALILLKELRSNELKSKIEEQQIYIQQLENSR